MTNEIVKQGTNTLGAMLQSALPRLRTLAPKYVNAERLVALALEARKNETLAKCSPESVVSFCKKCAEWGTDRIGSGGVWPVPYWNKKTNSFEMMPIPDWRMMIERLKRAGAIKHATSETVFDGDVFEYERGTEPRLVHKPAMRNRGDMIAVYCVYTLPDGTKDFAVMMADEVETIRKRSKAGQNGPWVSDYNEMAKKTVVKRTLKTFEGASIELTQMLEHDNLLNGYADIEDRPPVQMPVAIDVEPEPVAEPEETPKAKPTASKSKPTPAPSTDTTQATIGVEAFGQKGKRYWIKGDDGEYYSTFSDTTGQDIMALEKGERVVIDYVETTGKGGAIFRNLEAIAIADSDPDPQQDAAAGDDDVGF